MKRDTLAYLLSFNAAFVDTAGFLGLQGLFVAHVTGNFVTLGAALVLGTKGILVKLLALPEFIIIVAIVRIVGIAIASRKWQTLRIILSVETGLLIVFCGLALKLGNSANKDTPAALFTGFFGIAAMAVQNAAQRIHLANLPPTTVMTGNVTQAVLDMTSMSYGFNETQWIRTRTKQTLITLCFFMMGCAMSAALYAAIGLREMIVPVLVGMAGVISEIQDR